MKQNPSPLCPKCNQVHEIFQNCISPVLTANEVYAFKAMINEEKSYGWTESELKMLVRAFKEINQDMKRLANCLLSVCHEDDYYTLKDIANRSEAYLRLTEDLFKPTKKT